MEVFVGVAAGFVDGPASVSESEEELDESDSETCRRLRLRVRFRDAEAAAAAAAGGMRKRDPAHHALCRDPRTHATFNKHKLVHSCILQSRKHPFDH